ncbi:hypothetical protein [Paraburkholderia sp. BCC1886]|uniref:hypothetical protein n=1 Tax=Paraburkholderia sp. BCC1886 TaxID=2562670 RepID=UPI0011831F6E|nr:hypothetical protein [Paraburkholderia sp. BCC1886]
MSKASKKTRPPSRPPVDAQQYEKLALSAFSACDRQIRQLGTLLDLATAFVTSPAVTLDERRRERNLLEHFIDTLEQYKQEAECDRELYQVIALDAKGVPHSRITAKVAAKLLSEAGEHGEEGEEAVEEQQVTRKQERVKAAAQRRSAEKLGSVQH